MQLVLSRRYFGIHATGWCAYMGYLSWCIYAARNDEAHGRDATQSASPVVWWGPGRVTEQLRGGVPGPAELLGTRRPKGACASSRMPAPMPRARTLPSCVCMYVLHRRTHIDAAAALFSSPVSVDEGGLPWLRRPLCNRGSAGLGWAPGTGRHRSSKGRRPPLAVLALCVPISSGRGGGDDARKAYMQYIHTVLLCFFFWRALEYRVIGARGERREARGQPEQSFFS